MKPATLLVALAPLAATAAQEEESVNHWVKTLGHDFENATDCSSCQVQFSNRE